MQKRILVAEDNVYLSEFMKTSLESLGYEVLLAHDGAEAIRLAISHHPDLAIIDILMPNLDGFQLASLIRKNPETQSLKMIAMTALTPRTRGQFLARGFDSYIGKPFTVRELEVEIKKLLEEPIG
jgi:chemosensory pili system protein ChpA (sensor histidine kinase/response regulator)